MMQVEYRATGDLPEGVPAAVVAAGPKVVVLVNEALTAAQLCEALTPLIAAHVQAQWKPDARRFATG